jgi:hypothetical protein
MCKAAPHLQSMVSRAIGKVVDVHPWNFYTFVEFCYERIMSAKLSTPNPDESLRRVFVKVIKHFGIQFFADVNKLTKKALGELVAGTAKSGKVTPAAVQVELALKTLTTTIERLIGCSNDSLEGALFTENIEVKNSAYQLRYYEAHSSYYNLAFHEFARNTANRSKFHLILGDLPYLLGKQEFDTIEFCHPSGDESSFLDVVVDSYMLCSAKNNFGLLFCGVDQLSSLLHRFNNQDTVNAYPVFFGRIPFGSDIQRSNTRAPISSVVVAVHVVKGDPTWANYGCDEESNNI